MKNRKNDMFYHGVLAALAVVYEADAETLAEEIVREVGASDLLRVAQANEDPWLPNLQHTANYLKERG